MRLKIAMFLLFVLAVEGVLASADTLSSKVIIYRESAYVGSALSYEILANGTSVVKIRNASYYEFVCEPGTYTFRVNKYKNAAIVLDVKPGKTHYLRMGVQPGFWSALPELIAVDEVSAKPVVESGSLRLLDGSPLVRPKNRFGVQFAAGLGFENHDMFYDQNGKVSTLSYGGGFQIGLMYGYEFNRHFDLSFNLFYQGSVLSPPLKNVEASFGRGALLVTPAYIIPIDGGESMRFKIGAGMGYYFGGTFNVDGTDVEPGFRTRWNYKGTVGGHASFHFEMNTSSNWVFNYGIRFNALRYEFDSSNNDLYPSSDKLAKPNGSGLDFIIGACYSF
ncbi:MAG: hypothetical protein RBS81_09435 [Tenuifilaceae bacterium]|jgi:hypothetical protein|nr:hypothetical protein [Tenuifilaceae bacterium]